jgi:hypothetical protein
MRCLWPLVRLNVGRNTQPSRAHWQVPPATVSSRDGCCAAAAGRLPGMAGPCKGSASSANKISLGKYENSVCHVASTVAVKIDYR